MMSAARRPAGEGDWALVSQGRAGRAAAAAAPGCRSGEAAVPLDDARRAAALADVEALSAQAFRTLGRRLPAAVGPPSRTAELDEPAERDLVYVGVVGIIDPPRAEAADGRSPRPTAPAIRVMMITGDHPATAARIAADLGIVEPGARAVTGAELDALDDAGLRDVVRDDLGLRAGRPGAQAADRRRAAGRPADRGDDRRRRQRRPGAEVRRHRRRHGHHRDRGDQGGRQDDPRPTTTSPPSSPPSGRAGSSSTTSRSSCATCSPRTWARCFTVFLGVVFAGVIGLDRGVRRGGRRCRCWPPRSSGSTSSPTPAPRSRWAWTRRSTTSWPARRAG